MLCQLFVGFMTTAGVSKVSCLIIHAECVYAHIHILKFVKADLPCGREDGGSPAGTTGSHEREIETAKHTIPPIKNTI